MRPTFGLLSDGLDHFTGANAASPETAAIFTTPESSMSILAPVSSCIALMVFL